MIFIRRIAVIITIVCLFLTVQLWWHYARKHMATPPTRKFIDWEPAPSRPAQDVVFNLEAPSVYSYNDIVFGIITSPSTFYKTVAQMNTWVRHAPMAKTLFYSSGTLPTNLSEITYPQYWDNRSKVPQTGQPMLFPRKVIPIDVSEYGTHFVVKKTIAALQHMWRSSPKAKWFMKLDDDTFVVPSNYLQSLQSLDHTVPVYMGRDICCGGLASGGAGYTLSSKALEIIYPHLDSCMLPFLDEHGEELNIGEDIVVWECLKKYIPDLHTTDNPRQYMCGPNAIEFANKADNRGFTDYPVSFHWVSWDWMFALDWLIYYIKVQP